MVESQVREIRIKVDTTGDRSIQTIAKGFGDVNKNIKNTTSALTKFQNIFLAIQGLSFAGIGIEQIIKAADSVQKLGDRLKITEGSAIEANKVLKDLTTIANQNFASIEDISVIYTRLNMAIKDTGASSDALIGLTDTLQKTFRLSGSTAAETYSALVQMSQGLASGQLRGAELRSVLEANVVIGDLLAKQLNTTRGQLLKFAEKRGGISSVEVFQALANGMQDVNDKAANLRPTIQEALIRNFNSLKISLNDLNKEFGLTEKIITGLDFVFKNLDIIGLILGAAAAWSAYGKAVKLAATAQIFFNNTLLALAGSKAFDILKKSGPILLSLANGWGLLAASITGAVAAIGYAISNSDTLQTKIKNLGDSLGYTEDKSESLTQKWYKELDARKKLSEATKKQIEENNNAGRTYVLLDNSLNVLDKAFKETIESAINGEKALSPFGKSLLEYSKIVKDTDGGNFIFQSQLAKINNQLLDGEISLSDYNKSLKDLKIREVAQNFKQGQIDNETYNKSLQEINFGKLKGGLKEFKSDLRELNLEFANKNNIFEYSNELSKIRLERLNKDLREGQIDLNQFNEEVSGEKIARLNREFANGTVTIKNYNQAINEANIERLQNSFEAGTISAREFNEELIKSEEKFNGNSALFVGVSNYIESAGTISQNIANGITQTFGRLEDTLADFTKTGKFNFKDMTMAILDDLNRIIIRAMIIRPLAQGILGAITPDAGISTAGQTDLATGSTVNMAAKGRAYSNGIEMFANGGIVSSPTLFRHSRGLGMMGEAGSEAIMPLKRDAQGNLGVKSSPSNVTVNVINQSGMETSQSERTGSGGEKIIDILIMNKVKEGFATGAFDKQFAQQFGLRRRGA